MSKNLDLYKNIRDADQPTVNDTQLSSNLIRSSSEKERNYLDKPCAGCQQILCVACLAANGSGSWHMDTDNSSRIAMEQSVSDVIACKSNALKKLEAIEAEKNEFLSRSEYLKSEINKVRDELKRLVDDHADSLLDEVTSWEQATICPANEDIQVLRGYIGSLDKYSTKSMETVAKGSAQDSDDKLLQMPNLKFEGQMNVLHVNLEKTKMKELLLTYDSNIIGSLKDEEIFEFEPKTEKNEDFSAKEMVFNNSSNFFRLRNLHQKPKKTHPHGQREFIIKPIDNTRGDDDCKDGPVLIRTLKTRPAAKDNRGILGITVLDDELYAVSKESSEVEVFDCKRLIFSCELEVNDLVNPEDITSCSVLRCLYIMDCKTSRSTNKILRIDPNGRLIRKWSTEDNWGHLSVTPRTNVLLSVYNRSKLKEFSPQGHLIRVLDFSVDGLDHIRHAIELTSGHFVVSHGEIGDSIHRVVEIDSKGNILKTFSNKDLDLDLDLEPMKRPFYLEIDEDRGSILVADSDSGRILELNSNLGFKSELLSSRKHSLRYPVRICLDRANNRLFVVDNQVRSKQISVFDVK